MKKKEENDSEVFEILENSVREFCEKRISQIAEKIDAEDHIPDATYRELKDFGLMSLMAPKELGGLGLSYLSYSKIIEIISEYSAGVALSLEAHNSLGLAHILSFGSEELKKKALAIVQEYSSPVAWALTEPKGGSDAKNLACYARKIDDAYYISGTKTFITHGCSARLIVTMARTDKGITAFLVDAESEGLSRSKLEGKLGTRGPDTASLVFEQVRVPAENVIGNEGQGFEQAMHILNGGRIAVGAMGVGIARASIKDCISYSKERTAFGSKLSSFQALRFMIAELAAETEAAWQLVKYAAELRDNDMPHRKEAAMAKYFASQVAMNASRAAVQILGGYGYFRGSRAERMYRDAKLLEIGEGTNEVLKMIIAKEIID